MKNFSKGFRLREMSEVTGCSIFAEMMAVFGLSIIAETPGSSLRMGLPRLGNLACLAATWTPSEARVASPPGGHGCIVREVTSLVTAAEEAQEESGREVMWQYAGTRAGHGTRRWGTVLSLHPLLSHSIPSLSSHLLT